MADLTEESLMELLTVVRQPLNYKPSQLVVSQEGLDRMKSLCADDVAFKKRVLAEFPQLEVWLNG